MHKIPDLPDDLFLVDMDSDVGKHTTSTLSFSRATTVLLTFAANRFTRSASRLYQDEFGIGAMDWRMLVMLTRAPGCSVAKASKTIGIDKAAVSRSLARLEIDGFVAATCNVSDTRRKAWSLTELGQNLHTSILAVALQRQKKLLAGFTPEEVDQFNGFLRRFLENQDNLQDQN